MKIILLENLRKIGSIGDVINVKRGFARNYLIAKKKALYASKENIKEVEKIKSALSKKDLDKKKEAKKTFEKINDKIFSIKKLSTENNELYGSVKPTEISKVILETSKLDIKPSMIQLTKEIKALGVFKVKINLHSEVQAEVSIKVVAEETSRGTKKMLMTLRKTKIFNGMLIKFPKKKQDLRADLPTVGLDTLKDCKKANIKGIILKSKGNILLEKNSCISFANKNKMFIAVQ